MGKEPRLVLKGQPVSRTAFRAILGRLEMASMKFEKSAAADDFRRGVASMKKRIDP